MEVEGGKRKERGGERKGEGMGGKQEGERKEKLTRER